MGRYTTARSFDDRSTEVQAAPTEAEKAEGGKKAEGTIEISNTMGSTAGAGSGDFHQYRNSRRREMFRLEKIESDAKKMDEINEFERRKRERAEEVESKRAKNAAKRAKKKDKKRQKTGKGGEGGGDAGGGSEDDEKEGKNGKDEDGMVGPALPQPAVPGMFINGITDTTEMKVKEVQNIQIFDEDD